MPDSDKRGVILFIVLGTIVAVMGLSVIVLRIIESQSRLTHHQVSRIQAQYAAKAALIYTIDKLRKNNDLNWSSTGPYVRYMRKATGDIVEADLPASVTEVRINIGDFETGPVHSRKITATAIYIYDPNS